MFQFLYKNTIKRQVVMVNYGGYYKQQQQQLLLNNKPKLLQSSTIINRLLSTTPAANNTNTNTTTTPNNKKSTNITTTKLKPVTTTITTKKPENNPSKKSTTKPNKTTTTKSKTPLKSSNNNEQQHTTTTTTTNPKQQQHPPEYWIEKAKADLARKTAHLLISPFAPPDILYSPRSPIFKGKVIKLSSNKTVKIQVDRFVKHQSLPKRYIVSKNYLVHDETNSIQLGDFVQFVECRPISKLKRHVITRIEVLGADIQYEQERRREIRKTIAEQTSTTA
jgi:small subunit ribosomal protein S17